MPIANFTRPLTEENYHQIEAITLVKTPLMYNKMVQFDFNQPLQAQIDRIIEDSCIDLWTGYLINLPRYSVAAALLMQALQKRSEYFFVLQLQVKPERATTKYEVVDIHPVQGFLVINDTSNL